MRKSILALISLLLLTVFAMCTTAFAMPKADDWYWISSDSKYSKYFNPNNIETKRDGDVAHTIIAWIRTDYAPGGAQETLTNYKLNNITPQQLRYSLAKVEIKPQNRLLSYITETFYDENDKVLWQKDYNPIKPKEMNSQEFDEDFYAMIVDSVFGMGEVDRRKASDRWLQLWNTTASDGTSSSAMADTTTMRIKSNVVRGTNLSNDHLIYWMWQINKDANGGVKEIRFQKRAISLNEPKGNVVRYQHWDPSHQWQDYSKEADGQFHSFEAGSVDETAYNLLKNYAQQHSDWVYRYKL